MRARHVSQLDLNLLVAFHALSAERSVTRAAERLGMTQSGMSRTLARLREQLGDELFIRSAKSLVLTKHAETLVEPIETALALIERRVLVPAEFVPRTAIRTFTIATADYCEAVFLPSLVARLSSEAPGVRLGSVPTSPRDVGALMSGELDLVIALRPHETGAIRIQKLVDERFVSLVRKGHPALVRGEMDLDRWLAASHVLVSPHGRPGSPIDDVLAKTGLSRTTAVVVQSFLAAAMLAAETDMVTTLPGTIAREVAPRHGLVVVAPDIDLGGFQLVMSWFEGMHADPGHRWFRRLVGEIAHAVDTATAGRGSRGRVRPPKARRRARPKRSTR